MTKLSLCMIVKNEEATLPKCLDSVKDVVDEMIVMDTGSSDRTVEIARQFGAQVPYFEWCDDFSAARNEALKYVTGDWVLVLDADESLNSEIVPNLKQAIENENSIVVNLIRQEVGAAQSPYSLVSRLFRNHPEVKFNRPYHSIVDDSVAKLLKKESHWKVVDLPFIGIIHYGYQPEFISSLDKYNRARKAMEGFFKKNPNDPYICSKLGGLYLQMGLEKEGLKLLKQGLKNAGQANGHILFELYYHLGNAYTHQKQYGQAVKNFLKAINQPILPQLKLGAYNNVGGVFLSVGDLQSAKQAYETALSIDPSFSTAYYNLGMIFKDMGQNSDAIAAYKQAIRLNPNDAASHQNLGVVLYQTGYIPESVESFQKAINIYQRQNPKAAEQLLQGLEEIGLGELLYHVG